MDDSVQQIQRIAMRRHSMLGFDLHPGHALHHGAEWIGLHPAATLACAAAVAVSCAALYPGVARACAAWMGRLRPLRTGRSWSVAGARVSTRHSG